jgi:mRNA-degrading endonuclease RelE of RelBE toxin-antitoxin system
MAHVVLTLAATAELDRLANPIHARILKLIDRLQLWPNVSGAKPLRGEFAGHFRMRTGDYRVQFRVAGDDVTVERIGHRDGFL